jgi:hypothetical protein
LRSYDDKVSTVAGLLVEAAPPFIDIVFELGGVVSTTNQLVI